ncbi:MAG: O-antigen ligase family protein [Patescibacteria group bacterium]|nr:O-antigen ligase family protein [Patescibacteria group bacterium]
MKILKICDKIIEYSFYLILFLVPLAVSSKTFELFEFNKMWLTFGLTIILGASWFTKMIFQKRIFIQRTPLDIPIMLFLLSQIISTIFSLDSHISFWGYYSRFNGGLLSTLTYIFIYYAFVSNLNGIKFVKRAIIISLSSAVIVALWGFPSHFGYDPTCYAFRGTFDVSCWTDAFQPRARIFSTLGQPDWLASYLAIMIPVSAALFLINFKVKKKDNGELSISRKTFLLSIGFLLFSVLFYIDLLYTGSRSVFAASIISLVVLVLGYILIIQKKVALKFLSLAIFILLIILSTFFVGTPVSGLNKFSYQEVTKIFIKQKAAAPVAPVNPADKPNKITGEMGGTDSGKIRSFVWQGAINIWRANPIFGTGVETFAFAYYKHKPPGHNLTSEWDYLYNKAHNEYLNYLATTGVLGLGSYLLIIAWFLKSFFTKRHLGFYLSFIKKVEDLIHRFPEQENQILILGLLSGYISILIGNFFGFSVVITNIYFFLIPAFIYVLRNNLEKSRALVFPKNVKDPGQIKISSGQWVGATITGIISLYLILLLYQFWTADKAYALGYNLDRVNQYQEAYPLLVDAVSRRDGEPVFRGELAVNTAVLASAFYMQKDSSTGAKLAQEAIDLNNKVISEHPNNLIFWKDRVRIFYTLSQVDKQYLPVALTAIIKASELAPTDAKVTYNLGLLYGQSDDPQKAVAALEKTVNLKRDYRDAYYALGLYYRTLAVDKNGQVINPEYAQKAKGAMNFILQNINENDTQAKDALKSWGML